MMTEIDLNNTCNTAVAPTKPSSNNNEEDLELSETFHDEESFDEDDIKVTRRRSTSNDDGDAPHQSGGGLRALAARWSVSTLVIVTVVVAVVVVAVVTLPSSSASSKNPNSSSISDTALDTTTTSGSGNNHNGTHSNSNHNSPTKSPTTDAVATIPEDFAEIEQIENHEDSLPITLGCLTDRFDNEHNPDNNRLYPGQYICSHDDDQRYRFGLTLSGDVVLEDVESQSLQTIYENPHLQGNIENVTVYAKDNLHYYLTLTIEGTLVMHRVHAATDDNGNKKVSQLWTAVPQQGAGEYLEGATIGLVEQCLPTHDCPYLHLHKGGVMVLNWIDDSRTDSWQQKNFLKVYDF